MSNVIFHSACSKNRKLSKTHCFPCFVDQVFCGCRNWSCFCVRSRGQFPFYHDHLGRSNQAMYFLSRIIRAYIGLTSSKSTLHSSESTSLCTRDDVTLVDDIWLLIIALWGWFSCDVLPVTCCEHGPSSIAIVHFSKCPIATNISFT